MSINNDPCVITTSEFAPVLRPAAQHQRPTREAADQWNRYHRHLSSLYYRKPSHGDLGSVFLNINTINFLPPPIHHLPSSPVFIYSQGPARVGRTSSFYYCVSSVTHPPLSFTESSGHQRGQRCPLNPMNLPTSSFPFHFFLSWFYGLSVKPKHAAPPSTGHS